MEPGSQGLDPPLPHGPWGAHWGARVPPTPGPFSRPASGPGRPPGCRARRPPASRRCESPRARPAPPPAPTNSALPGNRRRGRGGGDGAPAASEDKGSSLRRGGSGDGIRDTMTSVRLGTQTKACGSSARGDEGEGDNCGSVGEDRGCLSPSQIHSWFSAGGC